MRLFEIPLFESVTSGGQLDDPVLFLSGKLWSLFPFACGVNVLVAFSFAAPDPSGFLSSIVDFSTPRRLHPFGVDGIENHRLFSQS